MFDPDEVSEGEYLSDILEGMDENIFVPTQLRIDKKSVNSIVSQELQYDLNKKAKVGETICCPTCRKKFRKKSYQQAFDKTKCKDRYWNTTDPERLERAKQWNK